VKGICSLFVDAAARGDSLLATFQPNREKIAQYERKPLAQRYAALLHTVAGKVREPAAEPAREAR